jgi:hypothetical protein
MLLVCFACSTALRGSLALVPPGNFAAVAAVILLAEVRIGTRGGTQALLNARGRMEDGPIPCCGGVMRWADAA